MVFYYLNEKEREVRCPRGGEDGGNHGKQFCHFQVVLPDVGLLRHALRTHLPQVGSQKAVVDHDDDQGDHVRQERNQGTVHGLEMLRCTV